MRNNSIKNRFLITLVVNSFKLISGVLASTIVPRSLGPEHYGNYQFIIRISTSIRQLFGFGSQQAFFTYNSKNQQSYNALKFYFTYLIIELVFIIGLILIAYFTNWFSRLYPDQTLKYTIIITIVEWLSFFSLVTIQLGESKAESFLVQKINLVFSILKIILLFGTFYLNVLTLNVFILINIVTFSLIIITILYKLIIKKNELYFEKNTQETYKPILKYFVDYCKPLGLFTVLVFLHTFFERWLLQVLNGSIQQAYFSIAFQWSTVSLLFSSSILNIFWREISYSKKSNDYQRMKSIIKKSLKPIFYISATLAIFLSFNSRILLQYFAGKEYTGAVSTLSILAFYPIHQTIGQMSSTFFLATENTRVYRNIGIIALVVGIIGTYFALAPQDFMIPGLNLKSAGLAAKMVLLQVIFTNVYLYFIAIELKINFKYFIKIQIIPLLILFVIGFLSFRVFNLPQNMSALLQFAMKASVYFASTAVIIFIFLQQIFDTKRNSIQIVKYFYNKYIKKHK